MTEISSVIFDIGNVFVHWDPRRLYRSHFSDTDEMEYFLREVTSHAWNLEQDRGRSFADAVALLSDDFPQYADLIRLFDSDWVQTLGDEISGTVEILEQLVADGVPVFAITNFSAEKWPVFCARHSFPKHFLDVVVSGEEKLIKPDRRLYELALERFNVSAQRTIFIDDSLENIAGAQALGIKGHHFKSAPALALELKAHGLLPG